MPKPSGIVSVFHAAGQPYCSGRVQPGRRLPVTRPFSALPRRSPSRCALGAGVGGHAAARAGRLSSQRGESTAASATPREEITLLEVQQHPLRDARLAVTERICLPAESSCSATGFRILLAPT